MFECPKCKRISMEWDGRAKAFICLYSTCEYVIRNKMKQAKEIHEIAAENAAIDFETETVAFQIREAASAGCFMRIIILKHEEVMELRALSYKVEFSHTGIFHDHNLKYYRVSW